jgi:hypothetical protein
MTANCGSVSPNEWMCRSVSFPKVEDALASLTQRASALSADLP